MNKIGSEFLDNFHAEKKRWFNTRRLCLWIGLILGIVVTTAVTLLGLSDILFYLFDLFIVLPLVFYGVSADKHLKLKDKYYFFILEKRRIYQTELDNE